MKILALDQATKTGWAVVTQEGQIVASGVWCLADTKRTGESRGMRYIRFAKHLEDAFSSFSPFMVCHEQTLLRGGAATEIANGLKAFILAAAESKGMEVSCVHTTELKKWATGSGKAEKPEMVKACIDLTGHHPSDDNEADAILIGLWAAEHYGTYHGPVRSVPEKKKRKRKNIFDGM